MALKHTAAWRCPVLCAENTEAGVDASNGQSIPEAAEHQPILRIWRSPSGRLHEKVLRQIQGKLVQRLALSVGATLAELHDFFAPVVTPVDLYVRSE